MWSLLSLLLLPSLSTSTTTTDKWTQGYLAEYFHQCEPGSFVDAQMKDDNFTPELVCSDLATNNCETTHLDFTNKQPGCKDWRGTECGLEGGFPNVNIPDEFSARYTGNLAVPVTGKYEFCLDSDDGSKLWIDTSMVVDDNDVHGLGWPECGEKYLTKGEKVSIQVNYYENDGLAGLRLYWRLPLSDDKNPIIIAPKYFSHNVDGGTAEHPGLRGEYFRQCHKHENLLSLNLRQKQPVLSTVVKKREINFKACTDFWCPDYVDGTNGDQEVGVVFFQCFVFLDVPVYVRVVYLSTAVD